MPDNGKITLVRHDGSLMDATPEQAGRLKILGYQEVSPEQNMARLQAESAADYYQSAGQQLQTLSEGVANGLDFGATDYLFGDDDTKARAQYNPGLRVGSEALGAMLPMFLTGGESAGISAARETPILDKIATLAETSRAKSFAEKAGSSYLGAVTQPFLNLDGGLSYDIGTAAKMAKDLPSLGEFSKYLPTNLLSDAAHALSPERTFTGALARGMVEGGVYGGAGAADHAYLDGDPITAETVLHGIGWGAVIGGGLGLVGHGIEVGGEHAAAAKATEEAATRPVPQGALRSMAGSEYGALRDEVANLGANVKEAVNLADNSAQEVLGALKKAGETDKDVNLTRLNQIEFKENIGKATKLWEKAKEAANAGSFNKANEAIEEYAAHSKDLAKKLNIDVADPAKPLQDLAVMRNVAKITSAMPKTVEAFASMGAQNMEATVAALEKAGTLPFKTGLDEATSNFKSALGLDQAGDLRAAHKTARSIFNSEGKPPKMPPKSSNEPSMLRKAVGYAAGGKAWLAAKATGFGRGGSYMAYRTVKDTVTYGGEHFAGVKAAALSGIREAAAMWGPGVGHTVQKGAGVATNPLDYTLFGEPDKGARDAKELAARRVAEIAQFAPVAKDAIYKAVQPIAITQPMLAPSMHKSAMQAFQALQAMAPRDPGAISALMSTWKPSDLQAQTFAKQLAVFRDPVGEAINALKGDRPDLVKLDALKKMAPAIYQDWRLSMIQRISQPSVLQSLKPADQLFLSVALDFPVHSRMSPGQISTGQQIFVDRSQPLKANPRIGQGGGLPNPSDNNNPNDTQATRSTER